MPINLAHRTLTVAPGVNNSQINSTNFTTDSPDLSLAWIKFALCCSIWCYLSDINDHFNSNITARKDRKKYIEMQNPLQDPSGEANMMYDGFMSHPMTSTAAYGPLPVPQHNGYYPQYSEFQGRNQVDRTGLTKKQREENNMRERKRVKKINMAFECLSEKVRPYTSGQKMVSFIII